MIVSITPVVELFDNYVGDQYNKRILFSGKFGSGKSYFLKSFFNERELKYSCFYISPVNYVVSGNENIFEYIKIDIVNQLLRYPLLVDSTKIKLGDDKFIYEYIKSSPVKAVELLLSIVSPIVPFAESIKGGLIGLKDGLDKFNEFKKKFEPLHKTDLSVIEDYIDNSMQLKGSIYEDDIVTKIIRGCIEYLNSKNQTVLIIDDLDRLDPEHIFRILNILSVHNENFDSDNKFGFSKVIVVCDIDNIKKIFEHRYGAEVDFEGYIDKFYSQDIFRFDNEKAVNFFCDSVIAPLLNDDGCEFILKSILRELVAQEKLTVRNLIKAKVFLKKELFEPFDITRNTINTRYPFPRSESEGMSILKLGRVAKILDGKTVGLYVSSGDLPILKVIKMLSIMCGDYVRLKRDIEYLSKNNSNVSFWAQDDIDKIISVVCIASKVLFNLHNPINIFFNNDAASSGDQNSIEDPKAHVFSNVIGIRLGWQQYDKDISYYANATHFIPESSDLGRKGIKLCDILDLMSAFLYSLEKHGLHNKLGLSGK
ncbi:P-loop NTPase fold protein [Spirosoma montaniterrae]|uniref:KAP NTPase domain-containing protein n=1 Tax=Spirosoma montaniterrae TaxID=1178516 RepID=A0A1P9WRN9_9BACT|nr:P-loop NTPase fold protein [Spirosoma montaniterrae]AQG78023.1 hypothetical protein AWR27_00850 [Spirosoma montaniterrae]